MAQRIQIRAGPLVQGDDEAAAQKGIELDQHLVFFAALRAGAVVDEEHVALVVVELRSLAEIAASS